MIDTILGGHAWSAEGSARDALVWQEAASGDIPAAQAPWLAHPLFAPAMRRPEVAVRLKAIIGGLLRLALRQRQIGTGHQPAATRLHALAMPTLVLVGEHDLADFLAIAERIGREASQVCTVVVPDAGYMVNMEAPEAVNRAVLAFWDGAIRRPRRA
ncbi:MAG: hypothetical protein NZP34_10055 [Caldilineales bacterium]|nr:hypothetical protein [Caldilineales bacterium]MCX7854156.1 hypothetical protein [Caldilineales bacterium]